MNEFENLPPEKIPGEMLNIKDPAERFSLQLYRLLMKLMIKEESPLEELIEAEGIRIWEDFKPRDAVDRMLVGQMMWSQAKIAYLMLYGPKQKNLKWANMMHQAGDRAVVTFERQKRMLMEHRNPKRTRHFTAIRQANIASQQIVSGEIINANRTMEIKEDLAEEKKAELPVVEPRSGKAQAERRGEQAMAEMHGTADVAGESGEPNERNEARAEIEDRGWARREELGDDIETGKEAGTGGGECGEDED